MIEKQKLIAKVSKQAGISIAKATKAYETILKENPAFRTQAIKTVTATQQVAVAVPGKTQVKEIKVKKEKAVKSTNTVEKIKKVEIIKEVPVKVIVEKIKTVEVIKEVPVEVVKTVEVIKEIEIIKEVPVIVYKPSIKEVKVTKTVPVEKVKEITYVKEVIEKDTKETEAWKKKYSSLDKAAVIAKKAAGAALAKANGVAKAGAKQLQAAQGKLTKAAKDAKAAQASSAKMAKELKDLKAKLAASAKALAKKPKQVIKEVIKEIEIIKEVPIEIIKEVEVVKSIDFDTLSKMMMDMGTIEVSKTVVGESRTRGGAQVVERRELKDGMKATKVTGKSISSSNKSSTKTSTKKSSKKASAKKMTSKAGKAKADDLTKIEGVGPKISQLLSKGGIKSYKDLANSKFETVKKMLVDAGPQYSMHDPDTWAKQAKLAASGAWEELQKLQDKLQGGKK